MRTMRLYLSSGFAAPMGIAESMVRSAELGYDGMEVSVDRLRASGEVVRDVRDVARRAGLTLTVHGPLRGLNFAAAERDGRELARRSALAALELASELGASLVVMHPGHVPDDRHDEEFARSRTQDALDALVPDAERLGVRIGIENMERRPREIVNTPDDCRRLLRRYSGRAIGLTVDFAHAWTQGLVDQFLDLAPDAIHVHMSDAASGQTHVAAWGDGDLAVARVCDGLRAASYGGAVVIEGTASQAPWEVAAANLRLWRGARA
jgi:sugar phosphate isomerase/epimerase